MYTTFNMGIGLVIVVAEADKAEALRQLQEAGESAYLIGRVTEGDKVVTFSGNAQ
jgi:phosphoribosylformylglycinamidine cyclo-ligase